MTTTTAAESVIVLSREQDSRTGIVSLSLVVPPHGADWVIPLDYSGICDAVGDSVDEIQRELRWAHGDFVEANPDLACPANHVLERAMHDSWWTLIWDLPSCFDADGEAGLFEGLVLAEAELAELAPWREPWTREAVLEMIPYLPRCDGSCCQAGV